MVLVPFGRGLTNHCLGQSIIPRRLKSDLMLVRLWRSSASELVEVSKLSIVIFWVVFPAPCVIIWGQGGQAQAEKHLLIASINHVRPREMEEDFHSPNGLCHFSSSYFLPPPP